MSAQTPIYSGLRESLERLPPGAHSCLIYESPEEQFAAAVPFMEMGLERGDKCIYLCEESSTADVLEAMRNGGIDTAAAMQSGALTLIPTRASVAEHSGADSVLNLLTVLNLQARGGGSTGLAGFAGVRLAREVPCRSDEAVNPQQLVAFDSRIRSCFSGQPLLDICQYDSRRFPPQVLLDVIRNYPVVIWDGTVCQNLHSSQAEERLAPDPTTQEVERVLANLRDRQLIEDSLREQCRTGAVLPVESLISGLPSIPAPSGCGKCLTQVSTLQGQIGQAEKMEALGRMASGVVHEFRNFLTVVLGCSELLIERMEPDDQRVELARQILKASQNAALLTNQLLSFGRPQKTRSEILDLSTAVAQMEYVLRCSLGKKIALRIVPAPSPCLARADLAQLEQVALNLVLNARDAMPDGGTITIQTANTNLSLDQVQPGLRSGPYVTLSVGDTGVGMDAETQKRIFEPFFTTKERGAGTGLGLSTVFGIVRQQFGGTISLESAVGAGTTFTIYLPRAEKPAK
jgi:signal transduction histidine kinase